MSASAPGERLRDADPVHSRALLGTSILFANNGLAFFAFIARLPDVQQRVGIDLVGVGLVLLVGSAGGIAAAPLVPRVLDRLGSARLSVLGSAVLALSMVGVALSTQPWHLAVALVVVGGADVFADLPMNAQASVVQDHLPRSVFSRLHGLWSAGALGGSGIAALSATLGIDVVPFLLVTAVVLAGVAVLTRPLLLDASYDDAVVEASTPGVQDAVEGDDVDGARGRASTGRRRDEPALRAGLLLGLLGLLAAYMEAPPNWGGLLVTEDLDGAVGTGALVVAAFSALQVVGRFAGDAVIDRVGPSTAVRGSALSQLAGLLVLLVLSGTGPALVAYALLGLGAAVAMPLLYRASATTPGLSSGAGLAAMNVGSRTGFLVGPLLIGAAADRLGVASGLVLVMGVTTVGLLVLSGRFTADARA